jgi:hypothetical protein
LPNQRREVAVKRATRVCAFVAVIAGIALVPPAALAEAEGIWSRWASGVTKREIKAEIPFVVLFSLPPMIVITPFWLVQVAVEKMGGEDDATEE